MTIIMKTTLGCVVAAMLLFGCAPCENSIYTVTSSRRDTFSEFDAFTANNNSKFVVQREINSPEFKRMIADRTSATPDIMKRCVINVMGLSDFDIYELSGSLPVDVRRTIATYIKLRARGHTKAYAYAALREQPQSNYSVDDIKAICESENAVVLAWLPYAGESGEGDLKWRWYRVIDGELAWSFQIWDRKGERLSCWVERLDAVQFDPRFKELFEEAAKKAHDYMEQEGIKGLGTVHVYWEKMQEYLRSQGVDWRSPSALNPSTCYD